MVNYPIPTSNPYRIVLLSLEMIVIAIFLEISCYFLLKYWSNRRKSVPSAIELDWGIIFGCFGIAFIFYIFGDYYCEPREFFLILAYLSLTLGGFLFFFHVEYSKKKKHRFVISPILGVIPIIFLVTYFIAPSYLQTVAYSLSSLAYGILILHFLYTVKRIWSAYKLYSMGLFSGILLWMLGYAANTDLAITLFNGFYIRVIGDVVMLFGMVLMGYFLNSIPSLAEIGWQGTIRYIILANKAGICLYGENFQEKQEVDEVLLASGVYGIKLFLETLKKGAESINAITKGKDVLLIHEGKHVMGILIVERELEILKYLLEQLVNQFEYMYSTVLSQWRGQIEIFTPTKYLTSEIFSVQKV